MRSKINSRCVCNPFIIESKHSKLQYRQIGSRTAQKGGRCVPAQKILNFTIPLTQQYLFCQAKGQPIKRAPKIGLVWPVRKKRLFAYSNWVWRCFQRQRRRGHRRGGDRRALAGRLWHGARRQRLGPLRSWQIKEVSACERWIFSENALSMKKRKIENRAPLLEFGPEARGSFCVDS